MGDRVWLKLHLPPYAQGSIASRVSSKLSYRYFGPYEVEFKIGSVAYSMKLPSHSSVHPVFHVSLLKKVQGTAAVPFSPLPSKTSSVQTLELVLDRRIQTKSNRIYYQLLIKWMDQPPEMPAWEDEDDFLHRFPVYKACGQAVANGGGDATARGVSG